MWEQEGKASAACAGHGAALEGRALGSSLCSDVYSAIWEVSKIAFPIEFDLLNAS